MMQIIDVWNCYLEIEKQELQMTPAVMELNHSLEEESKFMWVMHYTKGKSIYFMVGEGVQKNNIVVYLELDY